MRYHHWKAIYVAGVIALYGPLTIDKLQAITSKKLYDSDLDDAIQALHKAKKIRINKHRETGEPQIFLSPGRKAAHRSVAEPRN